MKSHRMKIVGLVLSVLVLIGVYIEFIHKPKQWQPSGTVTGVVVTALKQPKTYAYRAMVRLEDQTQITLAVPVTMILTPGRRIELRRWTQKTNPDKHKYEIMRKLQRP